VTKVVVIGLAIAATASDPTDQDVAKQMSGICIDVSGYQVMC
jgi:hypothetical protein